jgi:hypothetical protein
VSTTGAATRPALDYWLNRLFFDLQSPETMQAFRDDRAAVVARYPLEPIARDAVLENDVATLVARGVNPYLIRLYALAVRLPDEVFMRGIGARRD